jgi:hypothetical protein
MRAWARGVGREDAGVQVKQAGPRRGRRARAQRAWVPALGVESRRWPQSRGVGQASRWRRAPRRRRARAAPAPPAVTRATAARRRTRCCRPATAPTALCPRGRGPPLSAPRAPPAMRRRACLARRRRTTCRRGRRRLCNRREQSSGRRRRPGEAMGRRWGGVWWGSGAGGFSGEGKGAGGGGARAARGGLDTGSGVRPRGPPRIGPAPAPWAPPGCASTRRS